MIELPLDFKNEMKVLFGADYERLISSYEEPYRRSLSVNRLKATPEELEKRLPFSVNPSPFYRDGRIFDTAEQGVGNLALHHAGAFYIQEPSASAAVTLLDPQPHEKILDLCAAPGGKSAQIASCLGNTGLLWSNEAIKSRSRILLSNLERMGAAQCVVSSAYPEVFAERLSGYFDRVLVDAPCSGEGMFRKHPESIAEWSAESVHACAVRQLSILNSAAQCVRGGGVLVYSTCTFSVEENEGVIKRFLSENHDFKIEDMHCAFGRATGIEGGVRISPLEGGEGHFMVRMRRISNDTPIVPEYKYIPPKDKTVLRQAQELLSDVFVVPPQGRLEVHNDNIYILPDILPDISKLGVLRAGVQLGELKKNRIEPVHALFMQSKPENLRRVCNLSLTDERLSRFLHGEEIDCDTADGYTAVAVENIIVGFGKCVNNRLKNKYPKGLRVVKL
ncbi:MAG: RsmB/NOP family class I SAM-dependent RNA methyltransferase [Acutalibacteraceae bacterium]